MSSSQSAPGKELAKDVAVTADAATASTSTAAKTSKEDAQSSRDESASNQEVKDTKGTQQKSETESATDKSGAALSQDAKAVHEPRGEAEQGESDDEEANDDAGSATSKGAEGADSLRRKRDREGSLEPASLSQKTTDALPTKKNRLHGEQAADKPKKPQEQAAEPRTSFEGEKVGQIRKRVQDLSWKQRKEGERDDGQDDEEEAAAPEQGANDKEDKAETSPAEAKDTTETSAQKTSPTLRKQATFASFSSKSSGFGAALKDKGSVFDSAPASKEATPPTSPPATTSMRKQPTFSSFSSSSSPFNTASASVAGPSWLAGKPSSSGAGGIKPSALGSMGSSIERENRGGSSSPLRGAKEASAGASSAQTGKSLGFGAFAANKSFASGTAASGSRDSTPLSDKGSVGAASDDGAGNNKSFDEALRKENSSSQDTSAEKTKIAPLAERGQADLRTGEEDEQTIASVRAKLFTMAEDKSWKERGTGTVRCNVAKDAAMSGARLVMRAEGVLRLILNIKLFQGMGVNLEQDKFIRIVALEDGKTTTFAIKVGNAAAASQFYRTVKGAIPAS